MKLNPSAQPAPNASTPLPHQLTPWFSARTPEHSPSPHGIDPSGPALTPMLTCDEFVVEAKAVLEEVRTKWKASRDRRPDLYPERMERLDWIEYFSVCYPAR